MKQIQTTQAGEMACLIGFSYNAFFRKAEEQAKNQNIRGNIAGAEIFLTKEEERNRFCGCLDELVRRDLDLG